MTRLALILLLTLTAGCHSPFRRTTDVPACYFPKPNKAADPLVHP